MSRTMFKVCSVLLSLSIVRADKPGMPMMGRQPGMLNNYQSKGTESSMIINQIQNKITSDAMMAGQSDECRDVKDKIIEGVTIVPHDPITDQYRELERRQKCAQTKIEAQRELNKRLNKLIKETEIETKKNLVNKEETKCITKMDRANHECFIKNALNDFYTSVVWRVVIHDNVAQLWYHSFLVIMIVFEPIEYDVHAKEKECFTFFPTTNVAAEENALGHVIRVIGKPSVPKKNSKTGGECRPCTDFLKDSKTLDGSGMRCDNNCDPSNILFSSANFKSKKKNLLGKSEASEASPSNKTKEE